MGQHILEGTPPVPVVLRRSARARRISLRVSGLDGRVTLTLPRNTPEREALDFLKTKADWVRKNVKNSVQAVSIAIGSSIPFQGQMLTVQLKAGRGITHVDDLLLVPGPERTLGPRIQGWLKTQAHGQLSDASRYYAGQLGTVFNRITLRDTRSRWGSCSSQGNLMYSWRLIMAPRDVLHYVAAHEVAHLVEMNHSPAFWKLVKTLDPDYERKRHWLREHGNALHGYQFNH